MGIVLDSIYAFASLAKKVRTFGGPYIGVDYAEANVRETSFL